MPPLPAGAGSRAEAVRVAAAVALCDRGVVEDADLVSAFRGGDPDAFAAIYDRYADRLHDFCHAILRDRHEAADALQDTMLVAHRRLHQLRDPTRLRPWLFAIARHQAYRRSRHRNQATPAEPANLDMRADDAPYDDGVRAEETSRIVWEAAAGLATRDQMVLDLHVRQGLAGGELAEALGVTTHHADVLVSRVRQRMERALGALLVSRLGRDDCTELGRLLEGWDGAFSVLMRKRVARHVDGCEICDDTRSRVAGAVALLGAMPLVPAPPELRDRLLGEIERISSDTTRRHAGRSWRPPPLTRASRRRRVAAAAACLALTVFGAGVITGADDRPPQDVALATDADASGAPDAPVHDEDGGPDAGSGGHAGITAPPPASDPGNAPPPGTGSGPPPEIVPADEPEPTDEPEPSLAPTGPTSAPAQDPPASVAPPPPPPESTTTTSTAPPELTMSTSALALTPADPIARFVIRNSGGAPLAWTAASDAFHLSATGGTLEPGASTSVEVALPDTTPEGTHGDGVVVEGAGASRSVTVSVDRDPRISRAAASPTSARCGDTVRVSAVVTDESALRVRVVWSTPTRRGETDMTPGTSDSWTATLEVTDGPLELRVVAVDARGNSASADAGTVEVTPCGTRPPPPRR